MEGKCDSRHVFSLDQRRNGKMESLEVKIEDILFQLFSTERSKNVPNHYLIHWKSIPNTVCHSRTVDLSITRRIVV